MRHTLCGWLVGAVVAFGGLASPPAALAHDDDRSESRDSDRDTRETRDDRDDDRGEHRRGSSERSGSDRDDKDGKNDDKDRNSGKSGRDDRREESRRGNNRESRFNVERDASGADRERNEVLLIGPSTASDAVRNAGFAVISENRLDTLRQTLIRVRVRDGESVERTVETLRDIAPGIRVAPNHIFHPSQAAMPVQSLPGKIVTDTSPRRRASAQIGVIDTGADTNQLRLRTALTMYRGFAPGGYVARPHGTAVAQLAASLGATVAVADVFGLDQQKRLVARAELVAMAIDWLLSENIRILNISIEGPRNDVLEYVIDAANAQGALIVAAAGNGGPVAAPSYPGAYPGVVAVTALDEHGLIYKRAARGDHVQFAARGSYGPGQLQIDTDTALSGTSFAAPVVAAVAAKQWRLAPNSSREQVLAAMRSSAADLGAPGRDRIYGWGGLDPWQVTGATSASR